MCEVICWLKGKKVKIEISIFKTLQCISHLLDMCMSCHLSSVDLSEIDCSGVTFGDMSELVLSIWGRK